MEKNNQASEMAFTKENYIFLLLGVVLNIVGFIFMMGGDSQDYNQFNKEELFSPIRITVAPILIIAGYIVIMYAIMKSGHKKNKEQEK